MRAPPPIPFFYDGEVMRPKIPRLADRYYVAGESYTLVPHEDRSSKSHRHYFASVAEAWANLREQDAARFRTADHMRKWALIRAGYRDERSIVAPSKADAKRIAAFIRPMDEFAVITVIDAVVTVYTAKSQSMRAMGKKEFAESKQAVLDILAAMIGVSVDELGKARAA